MKVILLIEDSQEEMQIAKSLLTKTGLRFVSTNNLHDAFRIWEKLGDKINGILTDLNFPEKQGQPETACGFAVVVRAVHMKIPISICTSVDHHFCGYLKFFIEDLEKMSGRKIPFTMDSKDWQRAVSRLLNQL